MGELDNEHNIRKISQSLQDKGYWEFEVEAQHWNQIILDMNKKPIIKKESF